MENAEPFDVSVVLNVHDEAQYLWRTLRALEESARYAARFGLRCELIVVLDRADPETRSVVRGFDGRAFAEVRHVEVDNGSLGPSRNDGVRAARGRYLQIFDGDDLLSFNAIREAWATAERAGPRCVVVAEYAVGFEDESFVARYYGSDLVNPLDFVERHPYSSTIFARRDVFLQVPYADVPLTRGFAYEDWHHNANLFAHGCEFVVARGCIRFYRQRRGSLLRQANAISVRQTPHSRLFDPPLFVERMRPAYRAFRGSLDAAGRQERLGCDPRPLLLDDPACLELLWSAARIDPSIDVFALRSGKWGSNCGVDAETGTGAAYYELCEIVGGRQFTDVLLLPGGAAEGGEDFVLAVMSELACAEPESSCLVVAVAPPGAASWRDRLPASSVFVDLGRVCAGLASERCELVLLRLLLACAPGARLHLTSGAFTESFFGRFRDCLRGLSAYLYRFGEGGRLFAGKPFPAGGVSFLSANIGFLRGVITDNEEVLRHGRDTFGPALRDWHLLPAPCEPSEPAPAPGSAPPGRRGRLLWASPLVESRRPELIRPLARALEGALPGVSIDVFGPAFPGGFDPAELHGMSNLVFKGGSGSLTGIDLGLYDALVHTSRHDGLPSVILQAMAAGLPVVAPDLGGIGDVVDDDTGSLVRHTADAGELVQRYVAAVRRLYDDGLAAELGRNARERVLARHSRRAFGRRVREIFLGEYGDER